MSSERGATLDSLIASVERMRCRGSYPEAQAHNSALDGVVALLEDVRDSSAQSETGVKSGRMGEVDWRDPNNTGAAPAFNAEQSAHFLHHMANPKGIWELPYHGEKATGPGEKV